MTDQEKYELLEAIECALDERAMDYGQAVRLREAVDALAEYERTRP